MAVDPIAALIEIKAKNTASSEFKGASDTVKTLREEVERAKTSFDTLANAMAEANKHGGTFRDLMRDIAKYSKTAAENVGSLGDNMYGAVGGLDKAAEAAGKAKIAFKELAEQKEAAAKAGNSFTPSGMPSPSGGGGKGNPGGGGGGNESNGGRGGGGIGGMFGPAIGYYAGYAALSKLLEGGGYALNQGYQYGAISTTSQAQTNLSKSDMANLNTWANKFSEQGNLSYNVNQLKQGMYAPMSANYGVQATKDITQASAYLSQQGLTPDLGSASNAIVGNLNAFGMKPTAKNVYGMADVMTQAVRYSPLTTDQLTGLVPDLGATAHGLGLTPGMITAVAAMEAQGGNALGQIGADTNAMASALTGRKTLQQQAAFKALNINPADVTRMVRSDPQAFFKMIQSRASADEKRDPGSTAAILQGVFGNQAGERAFMTMMNGMNASPQGFGAIMNAAGSGVALQAANVVADSPEGKIKNAAEKFETAATLLANKMMPELAKGLDLLASILPGDKKDKPISDKLGIPRPDAIGAGLLDNFGINDVDSKKMIKKPSSGPWWYQGLSSAGSAIDSVINRIDSATPTDIKNALDALNSGVSGGAFGGLGGIDRRIWAPGRQRTMGLTTGAGGATGPMTPGFEGLLRHAGASPIKDAHDESVATLHHSVAQTIKKSTESLVSDAQRQANGPGAFRDDRAAMIAAHRASGGVGPLDMNGLHQYYLQTQGGGRTVNPVTQKEQEIQNAINAGKSPAELTGMMADFRKFVKDQHGPDAKANDAINKEQNVVNKAIAKDHSEASKLQIQAAQQNYQLAVAMQKSPKDITAAFEHYIQTERTQTGQLAAAGVLKGQALKNAYGSINVEEANFKNSTRNQKDLDQPFQDLISAAKTQMDAANLVYQAPAKQDQMYTQYINAQKALAVEQFNNHKITQATLVSTILGLDTTLQQFKQSQQQQALSGKLGAAQTAAQFAGLDPTNYAGNRATFMSTISLRAQALNQDFNAGKGGSLQDYQNARAGLRYEVASYDKSQQGDIAKAQLSRLETLASTTLLMHGDAKVYYQQEADFIRSHQKQLGMTPEEANLKIQQLLQPIPKQITERLIRTGTSSPDGLQADFGQSRARLDFGQGRKDTQERILAAMESQLVFWQRKDAVDQQTIRQQAEQISQLKELVKEVGQVDRNTRPGKGESNGDKYRNFRTGSY